MVDTLDESTIALAGLFQAASLVTGLARRGEAAQTPFTASIESLFAFEPSSAAAVYGGLEGIRHGLEVLAETLASGGVPRDLERTRYVVALMSLERRLRRHASVVTAVRDGIRAARAEIEPFVATHPAVIARLAETYSQTLSTLGPRIMVRGTPLHLNNSDNANRIRALLLAGVRAGVLWHQNGGRRWRLLAQRRRILGRVEALLAGRQGPGTDRE